MNYKEIEQEIELKAKNLLRKEKSSAQSMTYSQAVGILVVTTLDFLSH